MLHCQKEGSFRSGQKNVLIVEFPFCFLKDGGLLETGSLRIHCVGEHTRMPACLPLSNLPRVHSTGNEGAHFLREVAEEFHLNTCVSVVLSGINLGIYI